MTEPSAIFTISKIELHALRTSVGMIISARKILATGVVELPEDDEKWHDMIARNAEAALKILDSIAAGPS